MQIRVGYELVYSCPQPTPMIVTLSIHYTRISDLLKPDHLILTPSIPITAYRDSFGNWCSRIVAPPGRVRLSADALVTRFRPTRPRGSLGPATRRAGLAGRILNFSARQSLLRD